MKREELLYFAGSIILVISGLSHFVFFDLLRNVLVTVSDATFYDFIFNVDITLLGGRMNGLAAFNAYSLSFGVLITSFGILNLLLIRNDPEFVFSSRYLLLLNIFVFFIEALISVAFLFYLPMIGMILAFFAYLASYAIFRTTL